MKRTLGVLKRVGFCLFLNDMTFRFILGYLISDETQETYMGTSKQGTQFTVIAKQTIKTMCDLLPIILLISFVAFPELLEACNSEQTCALN